MGVLAEVFANALAHKRAREALEVAIEFERNVSSILAALLTARPSEHDRVIEAGLGDMARMLGVEDATLWQRVGRRSEFTTTHRWREEGVPTPSGSKPVHMPWIAAQIVAGTVVSFDRHADLPVEAESDLPALRAFNFGAAVMVPLRVEGSVVGALSFGTSCEGRDWSHMLIPRATLLGEVFTAVLARERRRAARAGRARAGRTCGQDRYDGRARRFACA